MVLVSSTRKLEQKLRFCFYFLWETYDPLLQNNIHLIIDNHLLEKDISTSFTIHSSSANECPKASLHWQSVKYYLVHEGIIVGQLDRVPPEFSGQN